MAIIYLHYNLWDKHYFVAPSAAKRLPFIQFLLFSKLRVSTDQGPQNVFCELPFIWLKQHHLYLVISFNVLNELAVLLMAVWDFILPQSVI